MHTRLLTVDTRPRSDGSRFVVIRLSSEDGPRPLLWAPVDGCFYPFESREELEVLLRAAFYALILPSREVRGVQKCLSQLPLREHRTAQEARFYSAVRPTGRTETDERAREIVQKEIAVLRSGGKLPTYGGAAPIYLDPQRGRPDSPLN